MKWFYSLVLVVALLFSACAGNSGGSQKKGSSGKTLEMLVVANRNVYNGTTKQLIDTLFRQPQKGLPQAEPMFDVVNIPVSSFENTEMFRVHRNVMILDVKDDNPDKVYFHKDQWAAPQVVFEFAASDRAHLDSLIEHYFPTVVESIYQADYRRIEKAFRGTLGYEQVEKIEKQFGFRLTVSNEFEIAHPNNPSPSFAWIRKNAKDFDIGVLVDVAEYKDKEVFSEANVLDYIDTIMRRHVPSSAPDSYMGTERRLDFYTSVVDFNDCKYAVETRGCWRSFGDFLGGPFVAYTLLDPAGRQVITLVGYVYCPRFQKRDYLMQVDGICHSLKFISE